MNPNSAEPKAAQLSALPNMRGASLVERGTMPAIRSAFVFAGLALVVCFGAPGLVAAQEGPVTRYVRGQYEAIAEHLRDDPPGPARDTAVGTIIDGLLDFDAMAQAALGTHWGEMTAAQQTEVVSLLRQLTRIRYLANVHDILDFDVEYTSETDVTGGTLVTTTARSRTERRAEPVEIAYSMHNVSGSWRAFDIRTEGVSTVATYRRQFHTLISEHGIDGLLQRMRDRLARDSH